MKTILITGGNSGIGFEAGRQLVALGHAVVLLGRDPAKGEAAAKALGPNATFHATDLSSVAGVKDAAVLVESKHPVLDAIIHSAGHLTIAEKRTADGLHPLFAVNYLSRYHLTQRLLPALRKSATAKVVLVVARVDPKTKIDFAHFPKYQPFPGMSAMSQTQVANFHYAATLARNEKGIGVACTNVGLVKTEIMREMPALMRVMFNVFSPIVTIPVARAAANPVHLVTTEGWPSGTYFPKPGNTEKRVPLEGLDAATTEQVLAASRALPGI